MQDVAKTIFERVSGAQAVRLANAIDWRGKSVLMHAASRDHAQMAELLLSHQARVDAADYTGGATALMLAARNGSLAAVETLIAAGAKVGAATPQVHRRGSTKRIAARPRALSEPAPPADGADPSHVVHCRAPQCSCRAWPTGRCPSRRRCSRLVRTRPHETRAARRRCR